MNQMTRTQGHEKTIFHQPFAEIDSDGNKTLKSARKIQSVSRPHKTALFGLARLARLVSIQIKVNSCWPCVQNVKFPLESSSFARETDFIFLAYSDVVCGLQTSTVSVDIQHWNLARPLLKSNTARNAHYIVRCASVLAWCYVGGNLPEQLVMDLL